MTKSKLTDEEIANIIDSIMLSCGVFEDREASIRLNLDPDTGKFIDAYVERIDGDKLEMPIKLIL